MAQLHVDLSYTIKLGVDELKLVHRGLHLLCASKDQAAAEAARALAGQLAAQRKHEFDGRSKELEKLLVNIEKGAAPPRSDANACLERDDSSPMDLT